ncbi:hypothetical protein GCM10022402_48350 [Salinactinospora qingdaonensis]|uniref:Uncharacterized protein n=1 Tax=Salinactinospora qingdaonensis TaxID=702744 RepID=A0ABP7GK52_9ACTN
MSGLAASARLRETRPSPSGEDTYVSSYDCQVGVMRARCEIEHRMAAHAPRPQRSYDSLEQLLDR